MKLDPILTRAVRLARKGNYNEAIKTLEIEANRYYGSFTYYYVLGISYLYSSIYGVALTYIKLAREQKMRDPNTMLGLAALYLNHGDTDKAVDLYLEVQSLDGNNSIAKRALKIIRQNPGPENISAWIDSGKLHTIFPPFPRLDISAGHIAAGIICSAAALAVFFGIAFKTGLILSPAAKEQRFTPTEITLDKAEVDSPVKTGGSYRYVLTRKQVIDDYNEGRSLFTQYRDEMAKLKFNRILESNAAESVKNKAKIILSYMETPDFTTLKDRFTYEEVTQDPFIYRDCHVIWRGTAGNLVVEQNHTAFDFFVGYDTYRTYEGIVRVDYDFAIPVNSERAVEILGRVIPLSSEGNPKIRIHGVALNQAGLLGSGDASDNGGDQN